MVIGATILNEPIVLSNDNGSVKFIPKIPHLFNIFKFLYIFEKNNTFSDQKKKPELDSYEGSYFNIFLKYQ